MNLAHESSHHLHKSSQTCHESDIADELEGGATFGLGKKKQIKTSHESGGFAGIAVTYLNSTAVFVPMMN